MFFFCFVFVLKGDLKKETNTLVSPFLDDQGEKVMGTKNVIFAVTAL